MPRLEIGLDIGESDKDPAEFRDAILLADKLGFDVAWLGDHFMPWIHSGNRSAFVWSLIGSSLEASKRIKVGPFVTTPIGARYHPALIAQASATLDSMYPGRFVLGVGTGEAMNEFPFFERWPDWKERMERLIEGTEFMRKLWNGNSYFDFSGKYFRAKQVYLYTKPRTLPRVHFSAVGIKSARFAGTYGDGLITVSSRNPIDRCRDLIFPSFDEGAKSAGRDPSKMDKIVSVSFSFDDPKKYVQTRRVHAGPLAKGSYDEPDPRKIEKMGSQLSDEEILRSTFFCSGWPEVIDLVAKFQEIGMTQAVFYSGPDKEKIRTFAKHILPHFRKRKPRK